MLQNGPSRHSSTSILKLIWKKLRHITKGTIEFIAIRLILMAERLKMDILSPFLSNFTLSVKLFFSGTLCIDMDYPAKNGLGYMHVLRSGRLRVSAHPLLSLDIGQPSLLLFPGPIGHRFEVDPQDGAELSCAFLDFGISFGNPIFRGLPDGFHVPLDSDGEIGKVVSLLFEEGFSTHPGRQVAVDRLMEYILILLLRQAIHSKSIDEGTLAGFSDVRLGKALAQIHERPEHPWSIEELASLAGMSRARFAAVFRQVIGIPPLEYVTYWRISLAQTLLKKGMPLKLIASKVGYSSQSTLSRAFAKTTGQSPTEWFSGIIH